MLPQTGQARLIVDASNCEAQWRAIRAGDQPARLALIECHMALARHVAAHFYAMRRDDVVEYGDYLHYAVIGLMEAIDRFDHEKGQASFATFASYRIRGSVINGIEKGSEVRQQSAYRKRMLDDRFRSLTVEQETSQSDALTELVDLTIGIALGYLLEQAGTAAGVESTGEDSTVSAVCAEQMERDVMHAMTHLSEREALVLRFHYYHGSPFEAIAEWLGVTKGRVSQIHKQALQRLREHLKKSTTLDEFY